MLLVKIFTFNLNSGTVIIYQAAWKYTLVSSYLQYEQINFYKGKVILRAVNRVTNLWKVWTQESLQKVEFDHPGERSPE